MTILGIDTSTTRGSVALSTDGELRLEETFTADRSHSASLFTVLERARKLAERIDLIAVGLGPGSYAGVRISISAAIGFQLGLGARIVGLPSVAALETAALRYFAIGDARRETFYFTEVEAGRCLDGPRLVGEDGLWPLLMRDVDLPVLAPATLPACPRATIALPVARRLIELAEAGVSIVAQETLEPLYLREPHITQPRTKPTDRP